MKGEKVDAETRRVISSADVICPLLTWERFQDLRERSTMLASTSGVINKRNHVLEALKENSDRVMCLRTYSFLHQYSYNIYQIGQ